MVKTSLNKTGRIPLNEDSRSLFEQQAKAIFDQAMEAQDISEEFHDQFEITTYLDHINNSIEARLTPKTPKAHDAVMKFWVPEPCLIDVLDKRMPIEQLKIYRTPKNQFPLESLQEAVGGFVEIHSVPIRPGWVLVCDEEAKLKNKPVNPTASWLLDKPDDFVAGTVLFCPRSMIE